MQNTTYILVADSGEAKVFKTDRDMTDLELVFQQENPAGRLTRSELESDRPGAKRGGGFHALGGDSNAHRHQSEEFARALGKYLHSEHQSGRFNRLLLAAPPHFLGELRQHLHKDCEQIVEKTVNKDLLRADTASLQSHFA